MSAILFRLRSRLNDLRYIFQHELKMCLRDQGVLIFFILVPLAYPLLYAFIYNREVVREVPVAVVDDNRSAASRRYVRLVDASPDVRVTAWCADMAEARRMVQRRQAYGMDYNRLNLLLAVLEKRGGLPVSRCDVYVNIAGGMRVGEPALDLAVIGAILSSCRDIPVDEGTILFGEVGLSGEVRAVPQAQERIREAEKLGFQRMILPLHNLMRLEKEAAKTKAELMAIREKYKNGIPEGVCEIVADMLLAGVKKKYTKRAKKETAR